jgi:5'-nucleotidase
VTTRAWTRLTVAALLLMMAVAGACGGDGGGSDRATPVVLRILVTNDDGIGGAGIDALVVGLETLPDVELTVVAPAQDRSGTGDSVTEPRPSASEAQLVGGHQAIAVGGLPADSVIHALDEVLVQRPHVVVAGINLGQNLGPVVYASGTVGAARTAARRGIPALAVSQGLADSIDYEGGVELALDWVTEHREALLDGDVDTETIANLNVPSCRAGEVRGVVEVTTATGGGERSLDTPNCNSTATDPVDDLDGFMSGYATLTEVTLDPPA